MNRERTGYPRETEKEYRKVIEDFNLRHPHVPILVPDDASVEHLEIAYQQVLRLWLQEERGRGDRVVVALLRERGRDGIYEG